MHHVLLAAAAVAQAFNLNCTGTLATSSVAGETAEQFITTYRIDLQAKKWCDGGCGHLFDFASIDDGVLTFQDSHEDTAHEESRTLISVNRVTGEYSGTSTSRNRMTGPIMLRWTGTCSKAAFSGWPNADVKF